MGISIEQMMKMLSKQLGVSEKTTFGDVVKTKAEKVGDKVFLTYVRDFIMGLMKNTPIETCMSSPIN